MATWPHHVISFVIPPNNILLNLPIALTYCLDSSLFWYTKSHSSIVENRPSYIALLKSPQAAIPFVEKPTSRYLICWEALPPSSYCSFNSYSQYPVCWDSTFFIRIRWNSDHPIKSCNWQRPTKQNQARIALALGGRDSSSKRRCQALENLHDKAQDTRHAWQSKAWLFDVCSTLLREKLIAPISL